jgi:hypothetical protein
MVALCASADLVPHAAAASGQAGALSAAKVNVAHCLRVAAAVGGQVAGQHSRAFSAVRMSEGGRCWNAQQAHFTATDPHNKQFISCKRCPGNFNAYSRKRLVGCSWLTHAPACAVRPHLVKLGPVNLRPLQHLGLKRVAHRPGGWDACGRLASVAQAGGPSVTKVTQELE